MMANVKIETNPNYETSPATQDEFCASVWDGDRCIEWATHPTHRGACALGHDLGDKFAADTSAIPLTKAESQPKRFFGVYAA